MKKSAVITALAIGFGLVLLGSGPCDEKELDDSLNPIGRYASYLSGSVLTPGSVVAIDAKLTYAVDEDMDPNSLDNTTVYVRRVSPLAVVPGEVVGFNFVECVSLNYAVIIEFFSWVNFDLSTITGWLNLRAYGQDLQVQLPNDVIELGQTLALYVADDGSTYYAVNDYWFPDTNVNTHDMSFGLCDAAMALCPSLTPDLAFVPGNLAAAGGMSSTTPFLLHGNSIDQTDGVNGGFIDEAGWNDLYINIFAIDGDPPYVGWDQINNIADFQIGWRTVASGYNPHTAAYLLDAAEPCPRGIVYTPWSGASPCDLNPLTDFELVLDGVYLMDGSLFPKTVVPFSTSDVPAGYTPSYCIP